MPEKDIFHELKKTLNDFLGDIDGSEAAFIATLDGHLLVERSKKKYPLEQVSPMAGSVLGISETLASQLLKQNLQDNIIIMEDNIVGLFKIQDEEDSLFFGAVCERLVNLGKMIVFANLATKEINKIIKKQNLI